jgi:hypothetical protein
MTKERFTEILEECGASQEDIIHLWETRPFDDLFEFTVRGVYKSMIAARRMPRNGL